MALLFTKSLGDLIRGIRANKRNEEAYINQCLDECRREARSSDMDMKAQAIAKLTYLNMLGYDMAWASFHIVEVMSSSKFAYKRLGYLAATLSFQQDTEVLIMCTNLLKKDLSSNNYLEVSLALNCLSQIVTPDLARTLLNDLLNMLNNSRAYTRKRTVLLLYKVFLKYPEALRIAFPRLKEKLEDPDQAVVSASVNVICELAFRNPKNYIVLAPQLYGLLTGSSNNWMLIKIVKLFGMLCPIEPRLVKKLLPPLTNLIQSSNAMSLLYECIHTVIVGGLLTTEGVDASTLSALCIGRLRLFLEDSDPNLKYLGLYILAKLLAANPRAVLEHKEVVLKCLEDADSSIRLRALDIVTGMVTQKNLKELVKRLIQHLVPSEKNTALDAIYRTEVVNRIVTLCSQDTYELVLDFEWYVDVLVDLVHYSGVNASKQLNTQLMDVGIRVGAVREYVVQMMAKLLVDPRLFESANSPTSNVEVIYAAAWLVGEFRRFLPDPLGTMKALLSSQIHRLPTYVQMVCVQSALKIFSGHVSPPVSRTDDTAVENGEHNVSAEDFGNFAKAAKEGAELFAGSSDLEVQQRASEFCELLAAIGATKEGEEVAFDVPLVAKDLKTLFVGDLNPVAPKAQRRVPIPEGLDLDEPFFAVVEKAEEPEVVEEAGEDGADEASPVTARKKPGKKGGKRSNRAAAGRPGSFDSRGGVASESEEEDPEVVEQRRREREQRMVSDPFYITATKKSAPKSRTPEPSTLDVDSIPIVKLEIGELSGPLSLQRAKKTARKDAAASPSKSYQVAKDEELPEGAVPMHLVEEKSSKKKKKGGNDEQQLASVDLTPDLLEDEVVPSPTSSGPTPTTAEVAKPKKKKKDSSSAAAGVTSPASEEPSQAATPKPKKKVKKRQVVLDDTPTTTTPAAEGTGSRDGGYEEL